MNNFKRARLKLTAWYVLFVMILTLSFSVVVYRFLTMELNQSLHEQALRLYTQQGRIISPDTFTDIYEESRDRIFYRLFFLNGGILIFSSALSYFLAGKTLQPLELAVDEQKRFIADASHELKTPLTSIKTEIEVALRDKKFTGKDARALLRSNLEEVDKMKQLTNYLLALSKYEDTRNILTFQKADIQDILKRSIKLLTPKLENRHIPIELSIENFSLRTNSSSLEDLFTILLDNAIKYSFDKKSITIRAYRQRSHGIVEIKDHGIGIKSSDLPYIFNRFYRADTSRSKHQTDGYGLGLSIAKSIVELHKGKIEVKSVPGKGSRFTVILPL
jgi:signal transduction histidine kinase